MSVVTNLIVRVPCCTNEKLIREMNEYFICRGIKGLISIEDELLPDRWYGGTKYFEADIYIGAFNHLDLNDFIRHIKSIEWIDPEDFQIIVKEQNDFMFRIINVFPED